MENTKPDEVILVNINGIYEECKVIRTEPVKVIIKILRTGEIKTIYLLNLS